MALPLPSGYISHSQINLWVTDKWEYMRRYFHGVKSDPSPEMEFGRLFAEQCEKYIKGEICDWLNTGLMMKLPVVDGAIPEMEIKQEIEGVPILAYLDQVSGNLTEIIDFKTGRYPWNDKRVQESGQLKLYALAIFEQTGSIPATGIVWCPTTKDKAGNISLTGEMYPFWHQFTTADLEEYKAYMVGIALEISEAWQAFLDMKTKAEKLKELLEQAEEIDRQVKQAKEEITTHLTAVNLEKIEFGGLSVIRAKRASWEYSDDIKSLEVRFKEAKAEEERLGIAVKKETEYFTFRKSKSE